MCDLLPDVTSSTPMPRVKPPRIPDPPKRPEPPPPRPLSNPPRNYKIVDNDSTKSVSGGKLIYKKVRFWIIFYRWDKIGHTNTLEEAIKFVEKYKSELRDHVVYLP